MIDQLPPHRIDLRSRREHVLAFAMARGMGLSERLLSRRAAVVAPPEDDPFHAADDERALSPGAIVDSRAVEIRGLRRPIDADAWQLKYRSTDTRGDAVTAVTTVMIPRRSFNGPARPLLSYQPAIDSLGSAADPSYTLRRGNQ